ncbi:Uncharacterized protein dnl_01810 [Desulfonema limicola]|uniref:Uncharacterized protein n=1 Tax=Desulfonema limicola TaxID=45656 RepID=A0A975B387_9BACT|nr:hypothetical protein [Desulfonema limicola]QTA77977.1 Uncharacterized protein dnl_01810 [Desulfonema limicola]
MQVLKIQKKIDSEILYLPEFRELIGKNVEIIIVAETGKASDTAFMSGTDYENRHLLKNINAAYNEMPDAEEQMILRNMRHCHRRLISEDGKW